MEFNGRIIMSNNGVIITPYDKKRLKPIITRTGKYDETYHRYNEETGFKMKYENEDCFITHYNKPEWLQSLFLDYEIIDMKKNTPKKMNEEYILHSNIKPSEIQYNIISSIMKDKKKNSKENKEWFVNLQTGYGKTLLSIYLASLIGYKTLIMCGITEVLKQWKNTLLDKTNFDMSRLLLIDSGKILDSIYNGTFDSSHYDIFICTPGIITGYGKKHGNERIWKIFQSLGIGLKIFDEAHLNKANIVKINALTNVRYTLYLSADFAQRDNEIQQMYYRIFYKTKIFKPSEEEMIDMRYTRGIIMEYNSNPDTNEKICIFNKYGFSPDLYMDYQFKKGYIFDVLLYTLNHIFSSNTGKYKILILSTNISHVDTIYEYLKEKLEDKYNVGRFHSRINEETKEYVKKYADIIVSTYKSFGAGLDVTDIKYVISVNQCNRIMDNQAAGRARPMKDGSDVFYFMFIDKGFNYCNKKIRNRVSYLVETKIKDITKIKYYIG